MSKSIATTVVAFVPVVKAQAKVEEKEYKKIDGKNDAPRKMEKSKRQATEALGVLVFISASSLPRRNV